MGIGIVDIKGLKHILKVPRGDALVMLLTLFLTVFVDLMWAVGAGMGLACLILVKRLADLDPAVHSPLKDIAAHRPWIPKLDEPERVLGEVFVVELTGSLFFGNAGPLQRKLGGLQHAEAVVIHMGAVPFLDQSGAYALADIVTDLQAKDVDLFLCALQPEPAQVLLNLGVAPGKVNAAHIMVTAEEAINRAIELHPASSGSASLAPEMA